MHFNLYHVRTPSLVTGIKSSSCSSTLSCNPSVLPHRSQTNTERNRWTQDALSLRTISGIIPKQAKGWTGAKTETVDLSGPGPQTKEIRQRYLFAIEDPFEIEHNVARTVVHNGIVAIRDEFRRAHTLIKNAGIFPGKGPQDLFAEAEEKENLQYRPFGPRPRKDLVPGQNGSRKGTEPVSGHKDERPIAVNAMAKATDEKNTKVQCMK